MRVVKKFPFAISDDFKTRLLFWAQQFNEIVWLDSNNHQQKYGNYKAILAVDAFTFLKTGFKDSFSKLEKKQVETQDWLFGYLTYDLKNDIEKLDSENRDELHFPDLYFFQPKKVFLFSETEVEIQYLNEFQHEMNLDWQHILNFNVGEFSSEIVKIPTKISLRTSKDAYFEKVEILLQHLKRGDIYEANFCQEFFSENVSIYPAKTFFHLNEISKTPFAAFLKLENHYALCASPERYLRKIGNNVISQPIKGSAKRAKDLDEDFKISEALRVDPKERSENIMIVDLVRNDLSRVAERGSVAVEELCGIYTFEQIHHMISTIKCSVAPSISPVEILKKTFPMGSMTGAPKISAMQIIEKLEDFKRGLYSGSIGYFSPSGDFDFNVVIRSILYNEKKHLSFSVGSAITAKSIPEKEYEECLLKAKAMREVLE